MKKTTEQKVTNTFEDKTKPGLYDNQYVVLKNVKKIYDNKFEAVHNFNLVMKKNEFVVFVGPSGCGKSTTLRMIAGLEDISGGELYINGEYANELLSKDRDIAMVFQNYALYPNMTVYDNMAFGIKIRKHLLPVIDKNGKPVMISDSEKIKELDNKVREDITKKNELANKQNQYINANKEVFDNVCKLKSVLHIMDDAQFKGVYANLDKDLTKCDKEIKVIKAEIADLEKRLYGKKVNLSIDEQKSELNKVKNQLNDYLYDADEYYTKLSIQKKIRELNKELKATKDKEKAKELKEQIKRFEVKDDKVSFVANKQVYDVNLLKAHINKLTKIIEFKECLANANELVKVISASSKNVENNNKKIKALAEQVNKVNTTLKNDTKALESAKKNDCVPLMKERHLTKKEVDAKVNEAATILEIADQLKKKPKELSGGQRQRVALGRAIVRNARIFLMDEPLSNLDAKLRVQMRSEIIRLHKKLKATTIYVTHDQTEAMTMADRIVLMKQGYIQQIGTPIEIYRKPANLFVASFIGSPAMNLISGVYNKGVIKFPSGGKYQLTKEQIKRHDEFYRQKYAEESRLLPEYLEKLETEKKEFEAKKHIKKDVEEFNQKYHDLKTGKQNLVAKLDKIIHGKEHEIIFGIRPEDIVECSAKDKEGMKVEIKLSELLGDQYFLHFDFGGKDMLSKILTDKILSSGEKINLKINKNKVHLFDKETECRI